jgi:hypothetical protein
MPCRALGDRKRMLYSHAGAFPIAESACVGHIWARSRSSATMDEWFGGLAQSVRCTSQVTEEVSGLLKQLNHRQVVEEQRAQQGRLSKLTLSERLRG